jgi:hypothetical protein
VVAAACGDNNKGTATPKTPPVTTTASTGTKPPATGGGTKASRKATLVMGTRNLLPLLQSKISRFAPTQVEGRPPTRRCSRSRVLMSTRVLQT